MGYQPDDIKQSMIGIYFFITVYFLGLTKFIFRFRGTHAMYSRSFFLVISSAVFGYLECLTAILYGILQLENFSHLDLVMQFVYLLFMSLNDLFFISLLLKIYRVFNLIKLNSGYFLSQNSYSLKKKLKLSWNVKAMICSTLILTLPIFIILITSTILGLGEKSFDNLTIIHAIFQFSLECLIMILLNIYIISKNCDITLKIEYTLYVIGWIGCYFIIFIEKSLISLLVFPIRNTIIFTINTASLYEHDKHFIIPLPDVIDLDFALKSKFFVEKIKLILNNLKNRKLQLQFEIMFSICVYEKTESEDEKKVILSLLQQLKTMINFSSASFNCEDESFLEEIFSDIYSDFDAEFFQNFIKSKEFNELAIEYSSGV